MNARLPAPGDPELFGPFGGRTWLNAAHQGPLPRVAAETARTVIEQKVAPGHPAGPLALRAARAIESGPGRG